MALLVLLQGGQEVRSYPVRDDETVVGRSSGCAIRADQDGISRKHARIVKDGEDYFLEDVGSSNGTFVNGTRLVEPVLLNQGDRIKIGPMLLRFDRDRTVQEDEANPSTSDTAPSPPPPEPGMTVHSPLLNVYSDVNAAREKLEAAKRAAEEKRRQAGH